MGGRIVYLFVGERPSPTAALRGWTWQHGRLCAKQLFDALRAADLDPAAQRYENLFVRSKDILNWKAVKRIRSSSATIVAMGRKVAAALTKLGVPHRMIPHPAARGKIRLKRRYCKAVRVALA